MEIVHIGTSLVPVQHRFGGALERRILEISKKQADAGHTVSIISPAGSDGLQTVHGVQIKGLRLRSRRPLRDYEFLLRARRWLNRQPPKDVLHAHGAPAAATALRHRFGVTVQSVDFFRYRGTNSALGYRYHARRLADFDLQLAASQYCAEAFTQFYPHLKATVRVLYNGVNLAQFKVDQAAASAARDALGLPGGPLVVYLGRVCEQKGSDLLEPLALSLRQSHPEATVVAAGPPEQFTATGRTTLTHRLELAGVKCLGAVEEDHIAGLLGVADVFVLPTRREEMFGMSALEAIACGAPVVAASLGGIPEAVGPNAILFPPGDAAAFIDAVTRVLDDPRVANELRDMDRAHSSRFDWSMITSDCLRYYAEAAR
jgi:glycosyltransferase involved in cell wall biosynthesis